MVASSTTFEVAVPVTLPRTVVENPETMFCVAVMVAGMAVAPDVTARMPLLSVTPLI